MWRSSEVLAWTGGDGPGRPPRGPSVLLTGSLAAVLGVSHVAMMLSDTLCPEHRAWVFGLAGGAFVASVVAVVGLLRGAASSALWTVVAASCGIAIGVIDATHDPGRGRLIALAFVVAAQVGAVVAGWQLVLWRWERRTMAALRQVRVDDLERSGTTGRTTTSHQVEERPGELTDGEDTHADHHPDAIRRSGG